MENKFLGSTGLAKILERLYDTFSKVGHTHDKSQITDFPTIPTNTSQLTNDSGYITADELNETITVDSELLDGSENPVQNKVIKTEFDRVHDLIGDDNVPAQIENAIESLTSEDVDIYVQDDEPLDASEGALWIDMDEDMLSSPSGNITLDQTLAVEGMAADAKAVGDAIVRLSEEGSKHLTVDIDDVNESIPNLINADTLGGKSESELSVANADNLGGYQSEDYIKKNEILNAIYPVGSIYMSVNSIDPTTLFGGEWQQIKDSFLLASGSTYAAGSTGGEATHILTENEMPSHNHSPSNRDTAGSDTTYKRHFTTNLHTSSASVGRSQVAASSDSGTYAMTATTSSDIAGTEYTTNTGGSEAHNNMPPYLAVYVWKRIS